MPTLQEQLQDLNQQRVKLVALFNAETDSARKTKIEATLVELDNLSDEHSSQWPLTLALALGGFAPMIRPLEIVEAWLRQKAHQWVGIPVKIKDRTRQLLGHLESLVSATLPSETARLPQWVAAHNRRGGFGPPRDGRPRGARAPSKADSRRGRLADGECPG
jgi:hypothetical protein